MQAKSKFIKGLKYTVFATNIVAIILLLLSVSAWAIVPSKVTFVAYLGLGFPFILVLNVIYLIIWLIFWRWRYALVQLIVLLLCWSSIFTYFPVHRKTKAHDIPESSIKILTYNVRGFNWITGKKALDNPIFNYIAASGADIVCMQEFAVTSRNDNSSIISEKEFNKIMKDYPYRSILRLGNRTGSTLYGIACYSKFPINKSALLPIESTYNGAGIYEINIKGKPVTLVNIHLESNRINAEDKKLYKNFLTNSTDRQTFDQVTNNIQERLGVAYKKRERQADLIANYIEQQDTNATIVCGDFNDTPISYAYHKIKGDMTDAFANTGLGQGITYHENRFWFRIDFIMHSLAFESYNCTVDKVKYSDHYPVHTYLHFK